VSISQRIISRLNRFADVAIQPAAQKASIDALTKSPPRQLVEFRAKLRRSASFVLIAFGSIGSLLLVLVSPPDKIMYGLVPTLTLLLLAVLALRSQNYSRNIYIFLSLILTAMGIPAYINNGMMPLLTIPVFVVFPIILIGGRVGKVLSLLMVVQAICSYLFIEDLNFDLWLRAIVTIIVIAAIVAWLVQTLENFVAELAESESKLIAQSQQQAQLFSIIGHELRTPLSSMKMMEDAMGLRNIGEYGANICDSTDSVLNIVDDLRTVVNPDRAHEARVVVDSPFDVLSRTMKSLEGLYDQQGVEVHVASNQLAHSLCKFNAQALRQKITNLTKNAAIHAEADRIWVDLQAQPRSEEKIDITLIVEDNGKGISEGLREAVFGAFSRGDSQAEGTRLGLYITRELAEKLGGTVTYFESEKGGAGFKVEFTLDLHLDAQEQDQVANTIPVALQGKRILFAEDQKTLQMLTARLLLSAGAEVVVCDNGKQALDAFRAGAFDIVLTDLMMPEMSGDELIRHIRADGFTGQIVALTAAIIGKETDTLLEAGADAVLNKPLDINEMKRTVAVLEQTGNPA